MTPECTIKQIILQNFPVNGRPPRAGQPIRGWTGTAKNVRHPSLRPCVVYLC